ncbi:MAG: glycosyltransferase family 2 protein [Sulfolobaceae archaeon]
MITLVLQVLLFVYPSFFVLYQIFLYELSKTNKSKSVNTYNSLPTLSIIVPTKGESIDVIQGLINNLNDLEWEKSRMEVIIVSDDDEGYFKRLKSELKVPKGLNVKLYRRREDERLGYKSGALLYGFKKSNGQLILTIDVDSRLDRDALVKAYNKLISSKCSAITFEWNGYSENKYSTLAKGLIASTLFASKALFSGKESVGLSVFPVGSGTLFKREVLEKLGGWDYRMIQDDLEIGSRMAYIGEEVCASNVPIYIEVPDNFYSFFVQQTRWALGTGEVLRNRLKYILKGKVSVLKKLDMLIHLFQYTPIITVFMSAIIVNILSLFIGGDILRSFLFLFWLVVLGTYGFLLYKLAIKLGFSPLQSLFGIGRLTAFTVAISPFITINFFKGLLKSKKNYIVTPKGKNKVSFNKKYRYTIVIIMFFGVFFLIGGIINILHSYYVTGLWLLYYSSAFIYTTLTFNREL